MTKIVATTLNGKYNILLPAHRAAREQWHTPEGWERKRLDAMHDAIKPGMTVLYCGTEMADMTALCAIWGANIVNVEPNPRVWPAIRMVWEANKLPTPLNYCGFASDITQEIPPSPDTDHHGSEWWKLSEDGWPKCAYEKLDEAHGFAELNHQADAIPQIRIDDLVQQHRLNVDILSIDCEGSEGRILRGAEKLLKEGFCAIFLSGHPEFLHEQYGEHLAELRQWIIDFGYKETLIDYPLHEVHLKYEKMR